MVMYCSLSHKKADLALVVNSVTENNIFSTKFICLRPDLEVIDSWYLYRLLCSNWIKFQKHSYLESRRLVELPNNWLEEIKIELPDSLNEQRRVAFLIGKSERILENYLETGNVLENLPESVFYSKFGSPVSNHKKLREIPLLQVVDVEKKHNYKNSLHFSNKVNIGSKNLDGYSIVYDEIELELVKRSKLPEDYIYRLNINGKINPYFLFYQLKTHFEFSSILFREESNFEKVRRNLSNINILYPDIAIQKEFSNFCKVYEKLNSKLEQQYVLCENIFYALSNMYFGVN